jgi:triosephosphate isomerase
MHLHIRGCLRARYGLVGADIRILYGGSVTSDNVDEILRLANVGGVLIGGASLRAADYDAVLRTVETHAKLCDRQHGGDNDAPARSEALEAK